MKLLLNGQLIPEDQYSVTSVTIDTQDSDENDRKVKSMTNEYTLKGAAYDMARTMLIESPTGKIDFITAKIFEDQCCEEDVLLFEGILRGDNIDWCDEECECTVKFIEHTEQTKLFDCVQSTLIYDNWNGFQNQAHPRVLYCIEMRPAAWQYVILAFGTLFNLILLVLSPVVAILSVIISAIQLIAQFVNAIINAINTIPGINIPTLNVNTGGFDGSSETNTLQEYINWINGMNDSLVGCGRRHPTPYLRDYILNVCDKCGLQFQSSILNYSGSDYYWTGLFSAPVEKGTKDESVLWIDENKPIETLASLLAKLRVVFSADWDIRNGVLIFEREDYFWEGGIYVNYETMKSGGLIVEKACYSYRDEELPAYGRFEYQLDALDWCGNEAKNIYNDIVEWNQPFNAIQRGEKMTSLQFGMSRYRNDGIDQDVISAFINVPFLSEDAQESQGALILPQGTAWMMKLLILDGQIATARTVRFSRPGIGIMDDEVYNYPYIFSTWDTTPNTAYPSNAPEGSLYKRFHAWKNPKLLSDKGQQFSFSFKYDCEKLTQMTTARYVQLPGGVGRIKKATVDLKQKTITITGHI